MRREEINIQEKLTELDNEKKNIEWKDTRLNKDARDREQCKKWIELKTKNFRRSVIGIKIQAKRPESFAAFIHIRNKLYSVYNIYCRHLFNETFL